MGHPAAQEKLAFAAAACRRLGKPCGIVGGTPEIVAKFLSYGYSWVAVASDMAMMVGRAQELLGKVRGTPGASTTPSP
jgi:2-keto-3-deoxy-L-rhamnonate aldolase RhmA